MERLLVTGGLVVWSFLPSCVGAVPLVTAFYRSNGAKLFRGRGFQGLPEGRFLFQEWLSNGLCIYTSKLLFRCL